ncbi:MAG: 50S ribosomal protein L24 [Gaiellales bacterium]|jgi:large subunit ribosomal protein L24
MALGIRKDDTVEVVSGKDRGKRGKVISVEPTQDRVIVEGRNVARRHTKPRPVAGTSGQQMAPGGILDLEQPLRRSNVMLVCPACDAATRISYDTVGDGRKVRVCKKCGTHIDK